MALQYNIFLAIQQKFLALRVFLLSFLPKHVQIKINLLHDSLLVMGSMFIARYLPSLRPYLGITRTNNSKLSGKNVIVTGANSGIGQQIATDLLRLGATVYLACRNNQKGEDAIEHILWSIPGARPRLHLLKLDTSDLESVKAFAAEWSARPARQQHIDILVHNAGIARCPSDSAKGPYSPQGLHIIYATNFLGSFVLTELLEGYLTDDARVMFTSSPAQYAAWPSSDFTTSSVKNQIEFGFHVSKSFRLMPISEKISTKTGLSSATATPSDSALYAQSKLHQTIFAHLLQQRWNKQAEMANNIAPDDSDNDKSSDSHTIQKPNRKLAFSFSPGYTSTQILGTPTLKTLKQDLIFATLLIFNHLATPVAEGSATGSWLAITEDEDVVGVGKGGDFWDRMTRRTSPVDIMSQETMDRHWTRWCADGEVEWKS